MEMVIKMANINYRLADTLIKVTNFFILLVPTIQCVLA